MDAVIPFNYTVVSASAEAESKRYKMLRGTQGRIWLVAEQGNPADNIYVSGGENSQGFGGRLITFQLNDEWPPGTRIQLKGPWHSNSEALYQATGYDIRNKHLTKGIISKSKEHMKNGSVVMKDVIYQDTDWVVGPFNRIQELAQKYANESGSSVCYYVQSQGGTTFGCAYPEPKEK